MEIKEMEENGTIDFYLDLKRFIKEFIEKNFPLSQNDLRSIVNDMPTDNVIKRQNANRILNEVMENALKRIANRNNIDISVDDFDRKLFEIEQEMVEKLWKLQHESEKDNKDER